MSENIENPKRAMIRQIIREVTKGEGSLVERARIQKLFDSEMKARIECAVDVQRQQMRAVDNDPPNGLGQSQLIKRGRQIAEELSTETPGKAKATLMALLCRVKIYSDRIEIALCRGRAAELLAGPINRNRSTASKVRPCVP